MGRVKQGGRQNGGPGPTRGAQAFKQRKKQKIVLESDSKGNKLRSVVRKNAVPTARGFAHLSPKISFRADPPVGYTFIPLGNPQLTAALKEFSRQENRKIHQVSVSECYS